MNKPNTKFSVSKAVDEIYLAIDNAYYQSTNRRLPDYVRVQTENGTNAVINQAIQSATEELQQERDFFKKKMEQTAEMAETGLLYKLETENAQLKTKIKELEAGKFWDSLFEKGITSEEIKNELTDYHFVLSQVPIVYEELTGGRMSKPNYYASDVIAQARSVQEEDTQAAIKEAVELETAELKTQLEKLNTEWFHMGAQLLFTRITLEKLQGYHGSNPAFWGDNKMHPGRLIHEALSLTSPQAEAIKLEWIKADREWLASELERLADKSEPDDHLRRSNNLIMAEWIRAQALIKEGGK
jgi:hypothetical protein